MGWAVGYMVCEQSALWVAPKIIPSSPGTGVTFPFTFSIPNPHTQSHLQSKSGNEQFELWGEQSGIWWVSSRVYGGGPQDYNVISWDWIPIPIPSPSPSRLTIKCKVSGIEYRVKVYSIISISI